MLIKHKDYLTYELSSKWCVEQNDDSTQIYDPEGNGAMTLSFYSVMLEEQAFENRICIMAKKFIDQNKIKMDSSLILSCSKSNVITLYGTGVTPDNWFIKLWYVAKFPRIVLATYLSSEKTQEVKKYDKIINSMEFQV